MLLLLSFRSCFLLFAIVPRVISTCYYPNGDEASGDVACNTGVSASACCGFGYSCLNNTICLRTSLATDGQTGVTYVRGSCTDQTWTDSLCPNFCDNPDSPNFDDVSGGQSMGKCENEVADIYYCGDDNKPNVNCTANVSVISFAGQPTTITIIGQVTASASTTASTTVRTSSASSTATSSSASASTSTKSSSSGSSTVVSSSSSISSSSTVLSPTISSTTSSTTSSTSSGPATSAQNQAASSQSSNNHGVAIGVGVGVSVGVIVLGLIAGFLFFKRKRTNNDDYLTNPTAPADKNAINPSPYYAPVAQVPPTELPENQAEIPPGELPHTPGLQRSELPVESTWATLQTPYSDSYSDPYNQPHA